MNILQICSAREIGGGERHFADLVNSLADRGHKIFAAVIPNSPLLGELASVPKENIYELRMRNSLALIAACRLARFVRENGVEIIHAHRARDYPLAAIASFLSGNTPYILTRHVLFPMKRLNRLILRKATRVISVSDPVADSVRAQRVFDVGIQITIRNGIRVERFAAKAGAKSRPSYLADRQGRYFVGMVGHLSAIKGQADLVHAARIVTDRMDSVDFIIAGEDKSSKLENRASIEELISRLGLNARVHLIGWIDDVTELLGALDLFVSPSRMEPFGLAMVEAMAAGVPVIASSSEGAREIIEDGVTGRLVPIEDPEALAVAVTELLANKSERERLSGNAREKALRCFSLGAMVDATEQVCFDVLNRREKAEHERTLTSSRS
ncbi:MAG: glycosyltransferase family 4 protein [Pyrinomonadaceae bacterium]